MSSAKESELAGELAGEVKSEIENKSNSEQVKVTGVDPELSGATSDDNQLICGRARGAVTPRPQGMRDFFFMDVEEDKRGLLVDMAEESPVMAE